MGIDLNILRSVPGCNDWKCSVEERKGHNGIRSDIQWDGPNTR